MASLMIFGVLFLQEPTQGRPSSLTKPFSGTINCTFDYNFCGYQQSKLNDFDWQLISGSTPSNFTGPEHDHTQASRNSGKYAYIESSNPRLNGNKARLIYPYWLKPASQNIPICLRFFYHMYGYTIGSLSVYVWIRYEKQKIPIWVLEGNQGNQWREAKIKMNYDRPFKIIFEGKTSYSYMGDIAIDDVYLLEDSVCTFTPTIAVPGRRILLPIPLVPPPSVSTCGIRPPLSRIVGGNAAKPGDWPWQTMLSIKESLGQTKPFCGGSLIAPDWIVTAAHCIVNIMDKMRVVVRVGAYSRSFKVADGKIAKLKDAYIHPSYNTKTRYNFDIAMIRLQKPVFLHDFVNPVCLIGADRDFMPGTVCWITGWGRLWDKGPHPSTLNQAQLPLVSNKECSSMESYPGHITKYMVCAGHKNGFVDTCEDDSGGPLVCERNGKWYLAGITSWGDGCGKPHKYGVYTRVKAVQKWIFAVMAFPDQMKKMSL